MSPHRQSRGFSNIELLVSTVVISVLCVIYLGPGSKGYETRAKTRCLENLQRLHLALALYAQEHGGAFPEAAGAQTSDAPLSALVPLYTTDTSLFTCPAGKESALPAGKPFAGRGISYAYYAGAMQGRDEAETPLVSDSQVNSLAKLPGDRVFAEKYASPGGNHRKYGGNVLFADGHVEGIGTIAQRSLAPAPGGILLNNRP